MASYFPLVTYPPDQPQQDGQSTAAILQTAHFGTRPNRPTLWIYTSSADPRTPSFDVDCLKFQSMMLFRKIVFEVKPVNSPYCAPDAQIPALHLPDGRLLKPSEIVAWIHQQSVVSVDSSSETEKVEVAAEKPSTESSLLQNPELNTWMMALEDKVRYALIYLLHRTEPLYSTHTLPLYYRKATSLEQTPFLTQLFNRWVASYRPYPPLSTQTHDAEPTEPGSLRQLWSYFTASWATTPQEPKKMVDEAIEVLRAIDNRYFRSQPSSAHWLAENGEPSWLDAELLACLHTILNLPSLPQFPHSHYCTFKAKVQELEKLCEWERTMTRSYLTQ